jgi:hypothetical protein
MTAAVVPEFSAGSIAALIGFTIVGGSAMGWALKQTTLSDPHRDAEVAFMKRHPCPANGNTRGECPGYVITLGKPLCAGGIDRPGNMQWQTPGAARKKERLDAQACRAQRKAHRS